MKKGGQVTKPIILVIKELQIFDKVTSWPQLISNFFGRACLFAMLLLIGPTLFYTPGVFI